VEPSQIGYVEAHGTGTSLGDPIEAASLAATLGAGRPVHRPLLVGSVKTNFGHLEGAAGIAGLIKTVLVLQHGEVPPHLHFRQPSPHIPWDRIALRVPTTNTKWPEGYPRRLAGVSSFGFGGTNAHVVLEAASPQELQLAAHQGTRSEVLPLSAKTPEALRMLVHRWIEYLDGADESEWHDIAAGARCGRAHLSYRIAVVADSAAQARQRLCDWIEDRSTPGVFAGHAVPGKVPRTAFLFPGQAAEYAGMMRELYERVPSFRADLEQCSRLLEPSLDCSLLEILINSDSAPLLSQTAYAQPALFVAGYALSRLWRSWGVEPAFAFGHSVGELAAACVAGVFGLEDGLRLVLTRGRLMQSLPDIGGMLVAFAKTVEVKSVLSASGTSVTVAAENGPGNTVLAGTHEQLSAVRARLEQSGVRTRPLGSARAFHSALIEPILDKLEAEARSIHYTSPQIGLISGVTGHVAGDDAGRADYWSRQARATVNFAEGVRTLLVNGCTAFLEMGPGTTLVGLGRRVEEEIGNEAPDAPHRLWLATLRRDREWLQLQESLAALYVAGQAVNWENFDRSRPRKRLTLPTYPFERHRFWVDDSAPRATSVVTSVSTPGGKDSEPVHPLLGQRLRSPLFNDAAFQSQLSATSPDLLNDHRIHAMVVVPAVAYIEMIHAAASRVLDRGLCVLEEVTLQDALIIPEDGSRTVHVVLTLSGPRDATFQIFSLDAEDDQSRTTWKLHVTGKVATKSDLPQTPDELSLSEIQSRCREEVSVQGYYQKLQERGFTYGPTFQGIDRLWRAAGEAVGHARLTEQEAHRATAYHIHPALVEGALQVAGVLGEGRANVSNDVYIPIGIDQFVFHSHPDSLQLTSVWSHSRVRPVTGDETATADVRIFDEAGHLVAEARGLHFKRARPEALAQALREQSSGLFYEVRWQLKPRAAVDQRAAQTGGTWLLLTDGGGVGTSMAQALEQSGAHCIKVSLGRNFERLDAKQFRLDPSQLEHFKCLVESVLQDPSSSTLQGIVYLWALEHLPPEPTLAELQAAQVTSCAGVVHLIQALGSALRLPPRLWLVTREAQPAGNSGESLAPGGAPVWGLGRVIAMEHPELWGGLVDLGSEPADRNGVLLADEVSRPDSEDHLAFRQGERYVARLIPNRLKIAARTPKLSAKATYLITGGLGGLGLQVARSLIETGARHLVLVGRSGAGKDAAETIRELEAAGAHVSVRAADVGDPAQVSEILESIAGTMPPLRGVIHAAGIIEDGLLDHQKWESFTRVLNPKMSGAWNLHILTRGYPLEFFVLFSSAAAVLGSPGQGNYAAANSFLDVLAHYRKAHGLPAVSVNWGPWSQIGMAAAGDQTLRRWSAAGIQAISPETGRRILASLFDGASKLPSQIAVLPIDWPTFLQRFGGDSTPPLLAEVARQTGLRTRVTKTNEQPDLMQKLKAAPAAQRQPMLIAYLRSQVLEVMGLDPSHALEPHQAFSEMGLDSLMGLDLKNRLQSSLGRPIPPTLVFEYPTIEALSEHLTTLVAPEGVHSVVETITSDERTGTIDNLEQLSEAEAEALLAEQLLGKVDDLSDDEVHRMLGEMLDKELKK
jgi:acyl transferase domain-containing protein